jgi:flagellar motor protein MotB
MKQKMRHGVLGLLAVGGLLCGCQGKKADPMADLKQQNQALSDDLTACQNELAQAKAGRDACQQDLLAARNDADSLRNQLASRPVEQISSPAPVPEGWTAVPGGAMIAIEGSVLFDSGKAKLKGDGPRVLDAIASTVLAQYSDKDVMVFGHTDDAPIKKSGWKDNYELSAQRALAVVRHLGDRGIPPKRLVACGCGEHRPRVANTSGSNRSQNRRVEIFVLDAEVRTASSR